MIALIERLVHPDRHTARLQTQLDEARRRVTDTSAALFRAQGRVRRAEQHASRLECTVALLRAELRGRPLAARARAGHREAFEFPAPLTTRPHPRAPRSIPPTVGDAA